MSYIVVTGIPSQWSLKNVLKKFASVVGGYFEAVNFTESINKEKNCYLRLFEGLNPDYIVECIKRKRFGRFQFGAFIPRQVPNSILTSKPKKIPKKVRTKLKINVEGIPEGILKSTHLNVLKEMQLKYPGLHPLFEKTNYDLYRALSKVVHERLLKVLEANPESRESCFFLSKFYRRSHPHFGDFQLILSNLHEVEQAAGSPRSQISEKALLALPNTSTTLIKNIPANKIKNACSKYSKKIIAKVVEHIDSLDVTPDNNDSEDDIVKKKVRQELKKMSPFVPEIIRQVISNNFIIPQEATATKFHLYGEPFIPNKDVMRPVLKRYHAWKVTRSKFMYNLIMFESSPQHYDKVMAADGTLLDCGAKLIIRPSNLRVVRHNDLVANTSASNQELEQENDEFMDLEDDENEY